MEDLEESACAIGRDIGQEGRESPSPSSVRTKQDHEFGHDLYRTRGDRSSSSPGAVRGLPALRELRTEASRCDKTGLECLPMRDMHRISSISLKSEWQAVRWSDVHGKVREESARAISGSGAYSDSSKENTPQITDIKLPLEPLCLFDQPASDSVDSGYTIEDAYDGDDDSSCGTRDESTSPSRGFNGQDKLSLLNSEDSLSFNFQGEGVSTASFDNPTVDGATETDNGMWDAIAAGSEADYPYARGRRWIFEPTESGPLSPHGRQPLQPIIQVTESDSTCDRASDIPAYAMSERDASIPNYFSREKPFSFSSAHSRHFAIEGIGCNKA